MAPSYNRRAFEVLSASTTNEVNNKMAFYGLIEFMIQ